MSHMFHIQVGVAARVPTLIHKLRPRCRIIKICNGLVHQGWQLLHFGAYVAGCALVYWFVPGPHGKSFFSAGFRELVDTRLWKEEYAAADHMLLIGRTW
jgi:hypothetical protein